MAKSKKAAEVTQDEVVSVSPATFSDELKATLVKYPHIDCVYVDEEGNWHLAAKPGYTAHSRESILNG